MAGALDTAFKAIAKQVVSDLGTALDIAGKGIADPASMIESIHLAETLLKEIEG